MHTASNPELTAHTTRRTTPVPNPHQSAFRRMCHLYSAGLRAPSFTEAWCQTFCPVPAAAGKKDRAQRAH